MGLTHTPGKGRLAAGGSSWFFSMWSSPQDSTWVSSWHGTWHSWMIWLNDPRKGIVQTVTSLWLGLELHTLSFSKYLSDYTDSPYLVQEETTQDYKNTRGLESPRSLWSLATTPLMLLSISVGQFILRSQKHCALWPPSHYTEFPLSQSSLTLSYPSLHAFDAIFPEEPCLNLFPDSSGASPAGTWHPPTSQNFS